MLPAVFLVRRLAQALRYAFEEEDFAGVLVAGAVLLVVGTSTYAIGRGWSIIDAAYFSLCTLTTTSSGDPTLTIGSGWIKVFSMAYQLVGIGVLVEILRRVGAGFVASSATQRRADRG